MMRRREMRARPVDVFKQLKIEHKDDEGDAYGNEDTDSSNKKIEKPCFERRRDLIPIPLSVKVNKKEFQAETIENWAPPLCYIHHPPHFLVEGNKDGQPEYVLNKEDERWLESCNFLSHLLHCCEEKKEEEDLTKPEPPTQHVDDLTDKQKSEDDPESLIKIDETKEVQEKTERNDTTEQVNKEQAKETAKPGITFEQLEHMITQLENATGTGPLITEDQIFVLFEGLSQMSSVKHKDAWKEVFAYWQEKRRRRKWPLLRRYWPLTDLNDSDPHRVFRPRQKEKYKLRRKKGSDVDTFKRMQQLRRDFLACHELAEMVLQRERLKSGILEAQEEVFEQSLHDLIGAIGTQRQTSLDIPTVEARLICPPVAVATMQGPVVMQDTMISPPRAQVSISPIAATQPGGVGMILSGECVGIAQIKNLNDEKTAATMTRLRAPKPKKVRPKPERSSVPSPPVGVAILSPDAHAVLSTPHQSRAGRVSVQRRPQPVSPPRNDWSVLSPVEPASSATVLIPQFEPFRFPIGTFMDELETRDEFHLLPPYIESLLDSNVPPFDYYSNPSSPIKYRIRGRLGRGGRINFDRIPVRTTPYGEDFPVVIQAGPCVAPQGQLQGTHATPAKSTQSAQLLPKVNHKKIVNMYQMNDVEDQVTVEPLVMGLGIDYDRVPITVMNRKIRYTAVV